MRSRALVSIVAMLILFSCLWTAYPSGLVSYWPFDANAKDEMGLNNGTVGGAVLNTTGGRVGGSYFFGGSAKITVPASSSLNFNGNNDFSIILWYKCVDTACGGSTYGSTILEKWSTSGGAYPFTIRPQSSSSVDFGMYDGTNNPTIHSPYVQSTSWHMFVIVKNASAKKLSIYIDGLFSTSNTYASLGTTTNSYATYFGSRGGSSFYYEGWIDEVAIFNRPITDAEISQYYANTKDGIVDYFTPLPGTLVVNFGTGGTATGGNSTFTPPSNQTINATANTGYYFSNWSVTTGNCSVINPSNQNTQIEVYDSVACYVQANFGKFGSLTVNSSSGGTASGNNSSFIPPANISIGAAPGNGYYFRNWTTNCSGSIAGISNPAAQIQVNDISPCYAQANFAPYGNMTVNSTIGGGATGNNSSFIPPANLTISASPYAGYYFRNWTTSCNGIISNSTSPNTQIQVNTATPCYTQAMFGTYGNLTVSSATGGSATGNNSSFIPPANLTINATANNGYYFKNWTTTCNAIFSNSTNPNTKIQVNDATSCSAQAIFGQYGSLVVNSTLGGTAVGNNSTFFPPANQSINATAALGYYFINWSVISGNCSISSVSNPNTRIMVFNTTLCVVLAAFAQTPGSFVVNFGAGGNATGSNASFLTPVNLTVNATAYAGYYFSNWSITTGNCSVSDSANPNTLVQIFNSSSCAAFASFAKIPASLAVGTNLGGTSVGNNPSFIWPANLTINATPSAGYGFLNWTVAGGNCQVINSTNRNTQVQVFNMTQCSVSSSFGLLPVTATFDGSTINFSAVATISKVTNFTLEKTGKGKIQFPLSKSIYAVEQNYDGNVVIGPGIVSVNTSNLDASFNSTATITMDLKGVYSRSMAPQVYYSPAHALSSYDIVQNGTICAAPKCTGISWDPASQILTFIVLGFSGYAVPGGIFGYDVELGINITSTNQIAIYTSNGLNDTVFDFKPVTPPAGGSVTLMSNETSNTTTGETGFLVQNQGNINVSINISSDKNASAFIGGTSPKFQMFGAENETGACAGSGVNASMQDLGATGRILCPSLRFTDSSDTIWGYILIRIDSDSPPRTNKAVLTFTSTEVN